MECASSDVNGLSNIHLQRLENKTSWAMLDLEVLHCPICFEPLTIPIFECGNGHLACSSCCPKLSNKCPSCALPIGHNRCRAMESVLESVFVPCQNAELGCTKNVSYGKQSSHDPECIFSRCTCPAQGCNFTSLYKDLYGHYKSYNHHLQSDEQEYILLAIVLYAAIMVKEATSIPVCNIDTNDLEKCRLALTGNNPPHPRPDCCAVARAANLQCLCPYKSYLSTFGINPSRVRPLLANCGLKSPSCF
ncbi:unnamed protein product [Arabidopsis arenosa]|uniref:RING-type E3 ubiquitin transferase n=1 Tax=Arabidopsis arenosa TaxID=38785 RepID=A0A8S2B3Q7_ARAAE|nr:unnamed protein product [Arabidopsis arenosa]